MLIPLGLYLMIWFLCVDDTEAARQQCRLHPRNQAALKDPQGGSTNTTSTGITPQPTSLPSSPPIPFIYGRDKVRGVNMFVTPHSSTNDSKLTINTAVDG